MALLVEVPGIDEGEVLGFAAREVNEVISCSALKGHVMPFGAVTRIGRPGQSYIYSRMAAGQVLSLINFVLAKARDEAQAIQERNLRLAQVNRDEAESKLKLAEIQEERARRAFIEADDKAYADHIASVQGS